MSSTLHLLQLQVDKAALARFAHSQQSLRHDDEGQGYALHAWLQAMFGTAAPKPFRWLEAKGQLLGYTSSDAATLVAQAQTFAEPLAFAALSPDGAASRPMPAQWRTGQRFGLEVLACPVERRGAEEKDAFLRALDRWTEQPGSDRCEPEPEREAVYLDWLRRQCGDALDFEDLMLDGWRLTTLLRRTQGDREARRVRRPIALFRGVALVKRDEAFQSLLARGIGRHRAFGMGCLLLSPA